MFRPSAAAGELVALPAVLALLGSELAGVGCKRTERLAVVRAEGVGCVKLDGEIWTARAYDDDEVIEPGTRVHVLEIRGATALVSE